LGEKRVDLKAVFTLLGVSSYVGEEGWLKEDPRKGKEND
jgi:hypothetical protein